MGLDMYLQARVSYYAYDKDYKKQQLPYFELPAVLQELKEKMAHISFEVAYWRKHPNLHGYFVENFGGGKDECQEIYVPLEGIDQLIDDIKQGNLPTTEGFFFGESDDSEEAKKEDVELFEKIVKQVNQIRTHKGYCVDLYYQASW